MVSEALPSFILEEEVAKVVNANTTNSNSTVDPHTPKAKIQKVPAFLRERRDFSKYYSPKLLSIGPIHHHDVVVKAGEQYKRLWTATYLSTQQQEGLEGGKLTMGNNSTSTCGQQCALQNFIIDKYQSIKDEIVKVIKRCYSEEVIEKYKCDDYEALAWMLFVDGCSVLEFMNKASYKNPEALKIKIDQLMIMQQDLLLLENQIPFELLKLLCKDTDELSKSMPNFLKLNHMVPKHLIKPQSVPICHLLDYLRMILCDDLTHNQHKETSSEQTTTNIPEEQIKPEQSTKQTKPEQNSKQKQNKLRKILCDDQTDNQRNTSCLDQIEINICPKKKQKNKQKKWPRHRNIQELKAAGIKVIPMENYLKANKKSKIRGIHFSSSHLFYGKLYLRRFVVDDSTGTIYCNLIAYEMCPDFENDYTISSYVAFLDSLIDHPEDVKELRRNGIVYNSLGSDQEVADLFNTLSTDLVPDIKMYAEVKRMMEKHCNNRVKPWMAEFLYTHFQSPWSVLALLAAILLLGLAIVQTYFTISPS